MRTEIQHSFADVADKLKNVSLSLPPNSLNGDPTMPMQVQPFTLRYPTTIRMKVRRPQCPQLEATASNVPEAQTANKWSIRNDHCRMIQLGDVQRLVPSSFQTLVGPSAAFQDGQLFFKLGTISTWSPILKCNILDATLPRDEDDQREVGQQIAELRAEGDAAEDRLRLFPYKVKAGSPGAKDVDYDYGAPWPVSTTSIWHLEDWTLRFAESQAGQALAAMQEFTFRLDNKLEKVFTLTEELVD